MLPPAGRAVGASAPGHGSVGGPELELPAPTQVFAVPMGEEARRVLFGAVTELRRAGVATDFAFGGKGLKNAMKSANRSGARLAIVAGEPGHGSVGAAPLDPPGDPLGPHRPAEVPALAPVAAQ
ncbi:histidyl-tRNA synthetase [Actinacidiphila glaucinigra]|uniref:Histidyl-tRNA synthetase n=1 Tax=Actinacidiphila glaucinigra TaxID=235986 RepID=A0A239MMY0_9ACTN|nr:histidyl-tRNA synthetase [Actinacidiphila glaucinigra]